MSLEFLTDENRRLWKVVEALAVRAGYASAVDALRDPSINSAQTIGSKSKSKQGRRPSPRISVDDVAARLPNWKAVAIDSGLYSRSWLVLTNKNGYMTIDAARRILKRARRKSPW